MITYYTLITILVGHWLADFFFQTDNMAKNKSISNDWLGKHVAVYSLGLFLIAIANMEYMQLTYTWVAINGVAHFFTDWVTSRASSALYKEERYHDFFVVIGFDQLIHYATLIGTFIWLANP